MAASPRIADAGAVTGYNENAELTLASNANDFDIVVGGNRTFGVLANGIPGPSTGATTTFNPVTNQITLTFFGAAVPRGTVIHFGYTLADGTANDHGFGPPDVIQKFWTFNGAPVETATPGFTPSLVNVQGVGGIVRYVVVYAQANFVGGGAGQAVHDWFLLRLTGNQTAGLVIANASAQNEVITSARGLFLTESDIGLPETDPNFGSLALGMLNNAHLPPTAPRFRSLGIPDGTVVGANGGTVTGSLSTTPEPTSHVMAGSAIGIGLGYWSLRRRRSVA